jgi:hypothetical protein
MKDGKVTIDFISFNNPFTFTNCNSTGRYGPALANCKDHYNIKYSSTPNKW